MKCKYTSKVLTKSDYEEQFPYEELKKDFLKQPDIAVLTPQEQEERWIVKQKNIESMFSMLSGIPGSVIRCRS